MVRRLESQHQYVMPAVSGFGEFGLVALDWSGVRGIETGLTDCAHGGHRLFVVAEAHGRRRSKGRPAMQSYPSFSDDSEGALGAEKEPVGIWPRA